MSTMALSIETPRNGGGWGARVVRAVLRVPLVAKLVGANAIIVASALLVHTFASGMGRGTELAMVLISLSIATAVNVILVHVALSPVNELEDVAERVSLGEFQVRSKPSPFADKELSRLGDTVNSLLDSLAAERKRIQDLGAEVVRAHDVERAHVSRELHDSIAQTLAAVRFQVSAAGLEQDPVEVKNRLAAINALISAAMEEIVNVSYSLHSRVAEELGLEAALESLARQMESKYDMTVDVRSDGGLERVSSAASVTLFRVAEEALRDLAVHSRAKTATLEVATVDGCTRIEVAYGPTTTEADAAGWRSALAGVKDRVMLAGGKMRIEGAQDGRLRVMAELPTTENAA